MKKWTIALVILVVAALVILASDHTIPGRLTESPIQAATTSNHTIFDIPKTTAATSQNAITTTATLGLPLAITATQNVTETKASTQSTISEVSNSTARLQIKLVAYKWASDCYQDTHANCLKFTLENTGSVQLNIKGAYIGAISNGEISANGVGEGLSYSIAIGYERDGAIATTTNTCMNGDIGPYALEVFTSTGTTFYFTVPCASYGVWVNADLIGQVLTG